jgi:hypothetical protein
LDRLQEDPSDREVATAAEQELSKLGGCP